MATAYEVVSLVNTLVSVAAEFGLSFQDLAIRQQKAAAAGRAFGVEDLEEMRAEAKAAIDKLQSDIQ